MTKATAIQQYAGDIGALVDFGILFDADPESLHDDELLAIWTAIDFIEKKLIKRRKAELKTRGEMLIEKKGILNEKGSKVYEIPETGGSLTSVRKKGKLLLKPDVFIDHFGDSALVMDTCIRHTVTMPPSVYNRISHLIQNSDGSENSSVSVQITMLEEAVSGMVAADLLDTDKVAECFEEGPPSFAFTVKKPKPLVTSLTKALDNG